MTESLKDSGQNQKLEPETPVPVWYLHQYMHESKFNNGFWTHIEKATAVIKVASPSEKGMWPLGTRFPLASSKYSQIIGLSMECQNIDRAVHLSQELKLLRQWETWLIYITNSEIYRGYYTVMFTRT